MLHASQAPPPDEPGSPTLLATIARKVRHLRQARDWTRGELARRSGLSIRFLARIEAGNGNVSVLRLAALADALGTTLEELVRPLAERSALVALVGVRGAGKSTIGPLLARRLDLPFIEMDSLIVDAAGLPLDQIFELHGERYYRRLERETLRRVLSRGQPAVLAAAGGVVNDPSTWALLCEQAKVVWLRASPEDHWNRVVAQGDARPMADNPAAMEELRALLRARAVIYGQAPIIADTADRSPDTIAEQIEVELARLR